MNKFAKVYNNIKGLRGKEVKVFGQSTILNDEIGLTYIDTLEVLDNLASNLDDKNCSDAFEIVHDLHSMSPQGVMNLYERLHDIEFDTMDEMIEYMENDRYELYEDVDTESFLNWYGNYYEEMKELNCNNSYNWNAPLSNDIDYRLYYNPCTNNVLAEVKVHRYGDVRSNYTDNLYFECNSQEDFYEALSEVQKTIYLTIKLPKNELDLDEGDFELTFNPTMEHGCYDVYSNECDIDDYGVYLEGETEEELKESLKEYVRDYMEL